MFYRSALLSADKKYANYGILETKFRKLETERSLQSPIEPNSRHHLVVETRAICIYVTTTRKCKLERATCIDHHRVVKRWVLFITTLLYHETLLPPCFLFPASCYAVWTPFFGGGRAEEEDIDIWWPKNRATHHTETPPWWPHKLVGSTNGERLYIDWIKHIKLDATAE